MLTSIIIIYLVEVERIHADEERLIDAVGKNSQEAVVSCLSLHWVNDLPGDVCSFMYAFVNILIPFS
jgi:hypothetical protein